MRKENCAARVNNNTPHPDQEPSAHALMIKVLTRSVRECLVDIRLYAAYLYLRNVVGDSEYRQASQRKQQQGVSTRLGAEVAGTLQQQHHCADQQEHHT